MKAWLVTWEWTGPHAAVEDRIAAVFRPRINHDILAELLETIYKGHAASLREWCDYARSSKANPYRAEWDLASNVCRCGHNPFLVAQYVTDLRCVVDPDTGAEMITWLYPPRYERVGQSLEIREARGAIPGSARRVVTGPLSHRQLGWKPIPISDASRLRDSRECPSDSTALLMPEHAAEAAD